MLSLSQMKLFRKNFFWIFCGLFLFSNSLWAAPLPYESFLPMEQGTKWVYRDTDNIYEQREIGNLKEINVPNLGPNGKNIQFLEVTVKRGPSDKILKSSFFKLGKSDEEVKEDTLYYLKTAKGLLQSSDLGEGAKEFWSSAFLLLPLDLSQNKNWAGIINGSRISFSIKQLNTIHVPAGRFEKCAVIQYLHGLETEGAGQITFCENVGETKVIEGGYVRELFKYSPSKKKPSEWLALNEQDTAKIWPLLPVEESISPESPRLKTLVLGHPPEKRSIWPWIFAVLGVLILAFVGSYFLVKRVRVDEISSGSTNVHELLQSCIQSRLAGDLEEAFERLKEMVSLYPKYADIHFQMGIVQEEKGDCDGAIESYKKSVRINSKYVEAHHRLAELFRKKGQLDEAISSYRIVLMIRPDFADAHNSAGEIHRALGNRDKARKHFEKALAINPHFSIARENLMQG